MIKNISEGKVLLILLIFSILSLFIPSVTLYRATVFIAVISCVVLGSKQYNIINPYYLFAITPVSLLLYFDLGGAYMLELSDKTWRLAIINISAFIFALHYTPSFTKYSNCISLNQTGTLVFSSIFFYVLSFIGGYIPQINALFWFLSVAAIVCALKTKKKIMYLFCAYIILSSLLSGHTSKMAVLLQCITILVCYDKYFVVSKSKIGKIKLFILTGLGVMFMIFAFTFANKDRGEYDSEEGMSYYLTQGHMDWNYSPSLFMPYMYLATPWTNLEYVVETQDTRTNGLWLVKPVLGYVGLDEKYEREYDITPYSEFNTFAFIAVGFKDFGFYGSILLSILLGFFVKKVYSRYEISKSPFDITSYILVALATAEMFFSNHFFMQSYPFTCFIIMEIWKVIMGLTISSKIELDEGK